MALYRPQAGNVDPRAVLAARNNAEWCDVVCRTHGIATSFGADAWRSLRRSPPMYPDAVTLRASVSTGQVLALVDGSPGCTVKDSFAVLDLSGDGFGVLFEAAWIYRRAARPGGEETLRWSVVRAHEDLRTWASAHGGGEVLRPALLDDPTVAIMLARNPDGTVAAGAIANCSDSVVGISNLFTTTATPDHAWNGVVAAGSSRFPHRPLVGYEHGGSLASAHRAGFVSVGPLRVWLKERSAGDASSVKPPG